MKKKFLSLLLVLAMLCSLFVPAMAAEGETAPYVIGDVAGALVILHTNDTHGRDMISDTSIGTAGVAQLKKDFEAAGANVLLLSAGDASQGTPLVNMEYGKLAVEFMNAAGYDAMAPGNHEFDWGAANLIGNVALADFAVLSANIIEEATNETLFHANKIFTTASGLKVGVFGLTTPETGTMTHPDKVKGVSFLAGEKLYAAAAAQVKELKDAGCGLIVAVGHLGVDDSSAGNRSKDLIAAVPGIDLFIDGHSHTTFENGEKVGDTLLVSTGQYLDNVGVVVYKGGALSAELISKAQYAGKDKDIDAVIVAANEAVIEALSAPFAVTEVALDGSRAPGVRTQETNLGDFAADAILWSARQALGDDAVDAALTNGGGIRETIKAGDVTMLDMKTVFPFGNEVATVEITGAGLLSALEAATWCTPTAIGAFPQVAGMEFTIVTGNPYVNGEPYGTYFLPANPGARIIDVTIGGERLDLDATYVISTNDFTAAGGDTFGDFVGAPLYKTGVALEDALVQYTASVLDGVITAEQYGKSAGRISITVAQPGQWYTDAVNYVAGKGIMTSTGNGFAPAATVTRASLFQTLYNMAGKPATATTASFTDVADTWYAASAAWAEEIGLATGTGDALYNGDRVVTRQEIATVLYRYLDERNVWPAVGASLTGYTDAADVASWATAGVTNMVGLKVITGKDGDRLDPAGTATRAELAAMLMRYTQLEPIFHEFETTISGDGHEIPVIVTLPNGVGPYPGVVMLHGTGSNKNEAGGGYDLAAPALARAGIASIRLDFMGNGASEADYIDYNFTTAVGDAVAAADYLAATDGVNQDAIGVMGWSQGGTIALLAAGQNDDFKAVVTWAGAPELSSTDAAYAEAKVSGYSVLEFDWRTSLNLGLQWHEDVRKTDVLKVFGASNAPVLAINGADDDVVDPAWAGKIVAAAKNPASDSYLIDNCDHTFNIFTGDLTAINDCIDATVAFFAEQLGVTVTGAVDVVDKYGNVNTNILGDKLALAGFEPGDVLNVTIAGKTLEIPYGTNYSDVDTGYTVVRNPGAGRALIIAINMGNFGQTYEVKAGDAVVITMAEKGGYYAGFVAHQVKRTNDRANYASDEVFANFREVTLGDIGAGKLYRSSSPVNNELGRAAYADKLIAAAGVATVINLADDAATLDGYIAAEGFDSPYYKGLYAGGNVVLLNMGVDFKAADFKTKLAEGLKFLAAQKGPYLIHCNEGKDRAGFVSALLEMLMGATAEEIMEDYMVTFLNYYNVSGFDVVKGTEKYNVIGEGNILESVRMIAGLEKGASLTGVDLVKAATDYLTSIGLTSAEISAIQANLK